MHWAQRWQFLCAAREAHGARAGAGRVTAIPSSRCIARMGVVASAWLCGCARLARNVRRRWGVAASQPVTRLRVNRASTAHSEHRDTRCSRRSRWRVPCGFAMRFRPSPPPFASQSPTMEAYSTLTTTPNMLHAPFLVQRAHITPKEEANSAPAIVAVVLVTAVQKAATDVPP
ncbi:hypothetical protein OAO87_01295 [bacterium]|nr:hypothetical protein [bacterium]